MEAMEVDDDSPVRDSGSFALSIFIDLFSNRVVSN